MVDNQIDMNDKLFKNNWPAERTKDNDEGWKHSDAKNIAYRYVFGLYNKWIEIGKLR